MRVITIVCAAAFSAHAGSLAAQPSVFPVTVGAGVGHLASATGGIHGMAVVSITPPAWPVALRLDGVFARRHAGASETRLASALSASAAITLRPWRVAPYLIVGTTRTGSHVWESPVSGQIIYFPARTEMSGGLGAAVHFARATLFGEMRSLGRLGTPISFGVTF